MKKKNKKRKCDATWSDGGEGGEQMALDGGGTVDTTEQDFF